MKISSKSALIVVDVQQDFVTGSLAVPDAASIISPANKYIRLFEKNGCRIVFSRDWHPLKHNSFKENGGLWPRHCVQDSDGAKLAENLYIPDTHIVVSKATTPDKDAYSAFDGTQLAMALNDVGTVVVIGLATDYCVKATAIDAVKLGFHTILGTDAIQGVNINPGDAVKAMNEMAEAGVKFAIFEAIK